MLPATAKQMAQKLGVPFRPELLSGTTIEAAEYQKTLGRAYFDQGLEASGGDVRKALMYYHGGPDQRIHGPKTRAYADQVLARVNGPRQIVGNPKPLPASESTDPNSRASRKEAMTFRKEFDGLPEVKNFKTIRASYNQLKSLAPNATGPASIAMIFSFMKQLDPTSVVREGEQATAQNSGGIPEAIRNSYNRILTGDKLSPTLRNQILSAATSAYIPVRDQYNSAARQYRGYAAEAGLNPDNVAMFYNPTTSPQKSNKGSDVDAILRKHGVMK